MHETDTTFFGVDLTAAIEAYRQRVAHGLNPAPELAELDTHTATRAAEFINLNIVA